jgi:hypothetical protein
LPFGFGQYVAGMRRISISEPLDLIGISLA